MEPVRPLAPARPVVTVRHAAPLAARPAVRPAQAPLASLRGAAPARRRGRLPGRHAPRAAPPTRDGQGRRAHQDRRLHELAVRGPATKEDAPTKTDDSTSSL